MRTKIFNYLLFIFSISIVSPIITIGSSPIIDLLSIISFEFISIILILKTIYTFKNIFENYSFNFITLNNILTIILEIIILNKIAIFYSDWNVFDFVGLSITLLIVAILTFSIIIFNIIKLVLKSIEVKIIDLKEIEYRPIKNNFFKEFLNNIIKKSKSVLYKIKDNFVFSQKESKMPPLYSSII